MQISAYGIALFETNKARAGYGYGIELDGNGNYKMTNKINLFNSSKDFLALRTTYAIKEKLNQLTKE